MSRSPVSTGKSLGSHNSYALSRRLLLMGAMTAIPAAAFTLSSPVKAEAPGRTALAGYDPVSYFTTGHPEQGLPQFSAAFDGANYHFASEAHRKMFAAHPGRYAPL